MVKKAIKTIDTVLEKIAPCQSSSLKEECFQLQNKKKEETQLLGWLTQALNEASNPIEMLKFSFYQLFVIKMLMINMFKSIENLLICLKG